MKVGSSTSSRTPFGLKACVSFGSCARLRPAPPHPDLPEVFLLDLPRLCDLGVSSSLHRTSWTRRLPPGIPYSGWRPWSPSCRAPSTLESLAFSAFSSGGRESARLRRPSLAAMRLWALALALAPKLDLANGAHCRQAEPLASLSGGEKRATSDSVPCESASDVFCGQSRYVACGVELLPRKTAESSSQRGIAVPPFRLGDPSCRRTRACGLFALRLSSRSHV